jgi:magnesium transporter
VEAHILDGEGETVRRSSDVAEIRAALAAGKTTWLDLGEHSADADALLSDTLGLHALTIEDIWTDRPSPKVDPFPEYVYVCVHTLDRAGDDLALRELDVVVGKSFVVTHDLARTTTDGLREELSRSPRLLVRGAPWIAHFVLDRLVDAYLPVIDAFDDDVEALDDDVLTKAGTPEGHGVLQKILSVKRSLQGLRRVAMHQREVLLRLARGEFPVFPADLLPYLRDVHDHFVRVGDLADSYRDLVTSALDAYLSVQSNRMNEVMKTLTLISTVMLPLTFVAGVYGMNFDHMPELHWTYGYPFALGVMATVAVAAVLWFRRKRWI